MSLFDKDTAPLSRPSRKSTPTSLGPMSRMRHWWPIILVVIGIVLLVPRILDFPQETAWLSTIGDIVGIFATLAAFLLLASSNRQDSSNQITDFEQLNESVFPFHIVSSITDLTSILLPEPTGDISLSDRDIPYIPRDIPELENAFTQTGYVLLRGRSKTGKTRIIIELLRQYWKSVPTILVLRRDSELQAPNFVPDNLPRNNLVVIIDDLHNHAIACKKRKSSVGAVISELADFFVQYCGNQPGEVRFILITRKEPECWDQLEYSNTNYPWNDFKLVELPDLSFEAARQLVLELASIPPTLKISSELADSIARSNDGTYYRLILAFRDWRSQNKREISIADISNLQGDLVSAWRYRRLNIYRYKPNLKYIYASLDLTKSIGLPTQKDLIILFTQLLQYHQTVRIVGWIMQVKKKLSGWLQAKFRKVSISKTSIRLNILYLTLVSRLYRVIVWPFRILLHQVHYNNYWFRKLVSQLLSGLYYTMMFLVIAIPFATLGYILNAVLERTTLSKLIAQFLQSNDWIKSIRPLA